MNLFEFMDRMCDLGVDGIQIDIMHLESKDPVYLREISTYAKNKDLFIEYGSTGIEKGHTLDELYVAHELGAKLMKTINSKTVGVCVDLGNFMIHQEKPIESVKKLAPYIINTHFKDYTVEMMNWGFKSYGVPLGQGIIDLKGILDILKNSSKLERIILEIPVEKESNEEATLKKENSYVEESIRYARDVLSI